MDPRVFQFRLRSQPGSEPGAGAIVVERLSDAGDWQAQEPSLRTPPFRLHLISLLLCLRHHLEAEARERRIPLRQVEASFTASVSDSWDLQQLDVRFSLRLDPEASPEARARADGAALAAMHERMRLSPVPRNRPAGVPLKLDLALQH
jgi:hypothetical protein